MRHDGKLPYSPVKRTGCRVLLSTASLTAMALCLAAQEASAACPAGQVVGVFTTSPGDVCTGGLSAGAGGFLSVFGTAVPVASVPPTDAVQATAGGDISLAAAPITVTPALSDFATGLRASGSGSTITGLGRPIIISSGSTNVSGGIIADSGGRIILGNGFEVTASGFNSSGVGADGTGSFVDARNGSTITVTASAPDTAGVLMLRGGLVALDATTQLTAIGSGVAGIKVDGTVVPIGTIASGTVINLVGDPNSTENALGLWATQQVGTIPSIVNVSGLIVQGPSPRSLGLFTIGSTINAAASTITVNGAAGTGAAAAMDGGTINLTDTTLLINGAGTGAVRARNFFGPTTNVFTASGGSISAPQSPAIIAQGAVLEATLSNGVVVTGNGRLVTASPRADSTGTVRPSTVNLAATSGAILTGDAFADPTSTLNMNVSGGARWTGAALNVTNVNVGAGGTWTINANSDVAQQVTNAGLIAFAPPVGNPTALSSYRTLTTTDYSGVGGTLGLNTFLGSDNSPSDRLIINEGTANGGSFLRVTNVGGGGAVTTGNGITVVDTTNGGTTTPNAFALEGAEVAAGPYLYTLFRSSVDGSNDQAWYLRSTLPPPPSPPPPPGPPGPPPPSPPGPQIPNIRAEVSLFAALPAMAALYGNRIIDTLHERLGEEEQLRGRADLSQGYVNGVWGRILAHHGEREGDGILGNGPKYDYDFFAFQAGLDIYRREYQDGSRDHAGTYFAVGHAEGDVDHNLLGRRLLGGSDEFDAYTLGGYWTHFGPSGWYLDGVLQGTWYDFTEKPLRRQSTDTEGYGVAASLETGYPIRLGSGFVLEPQAQLVYQTLDIDNARDFASTVRFRDDDFLSGRIGVRLASTWAMDQGIPQPRLITAWLRGNVWHEFLGEPKTEFSSAVGFVPFRADLGGTWGELGAGISAQINRSASLYANANYQRSFDGDREAYEGKIGLRFNW